MPCGRQKAKATLSRSLVPALFLCACSLPPDLNASMSAHSLVVAGHDCSAGLANSNIPSNNLYFLTSFTGGGMACGGTADGVSLYAADEQRFGCGAHLRITNPANGASCVAKVSDYGPNVCVEEAVNNMPVIDASPAIAQALFGVNSAGWSDRFEISAVPTTDPVGCGQPSGNGSAGGTGGGTGPSTGGGAACATDSDCNGGQPATGMVCGNAGTCLSACHSSFDCTSWETCDVGNSFQCLPNACGQDSDCNGGATGLQVICNNSGVCASGCHGNSDCSGGTSCDMSLTEWVCD